VLAGGCRCGAVRYTLAVEVIPPAYCCHCLDCQTWSGSAFAEQAVVAADAMSVQGEMAEYAFVNASGSTSRQFICGTCHARIYNTNSARPGLAIVRAGTLDEGDRIVPRLHIWIKRKQPWIALGGDVPCYSESAPPAEFAAILLIA
jgi:hypothetical protein